MTREPVTCGCGAVLKDSYPSAIVAHGETKRHQAWLVDKYGSLAGAPIVEPEPKIPGQNEGELAGAYLARVEQMLGAGAYGAFIATDAGQALLGQAALDDKEARKAAAKAELREKILAAKERDRQAVLARAAGPVVIVKAPTNGKPTKAARAAGVTAPPKERPMRAPRVNDARRTELPKRTYTIEGGKLVPPTVDGVNRPLKIGTEPIEIDGVKRYPLLHRNGDIAGHQTDNYPWRCPVDGKRIRAAACPQHPDQRAPKGYRADDRIVR